ncbi:MAG TPA: outer membrane beta-barrel protein [Burkholderiales bacterium]
MTSARTLVPSRLLAALCSILLTAPALAAVPLAGRDADRLAKSAAPPKDQAFVYVYRREDRSNVALTVTLNGRDTVRLDSRTFALWKVKPGRIEITARGTTSALAFTVQGGRVYYVEVSRLPSGVPALRQVSFPIGRTEVHRSRLVEQGAAARVVPPAAPAPATRAPKAATPPPPARRQGPDRFALMIKPGSFKIDTQSQTLNLVSGTSTLQFDTSSSSVFGLEGEWLVRPDISVGVEVVKFSNKHVDTSVTPPPPNDGSTDTLAFLVNAKRYFLPASDWQPYVGAGLGSAVVDFAGPVTGSTSGIALQVMGGVQWRRDQFALRAEYKRLKADTEDNTGQKVDMSGSGFFLGIGFYF